MKPSGKFNAFVIGLCLFVLIVAGAAAIATETSSDADNVDYFTGRLESLGTDSVTINGTTYTLGSSVKYLSADGSTIDSRSFATDEIVKIHVDTNNIIRIIRKN